MAHTSLILAHGDEQAVQLWGCGLGKRAHILNKLAGFGAGLLAKSLVGYDHQLFSVDIVNHADWESCGALFLS